MTRNTGFLHSKYLYISGVHLRRWTESSTEESQGINSRSEELPGDSRATRLYVFHLNYFYLWQGEYYCFISGKIENQRGEIACSNPHFWGVKQNWKPGL